MLKHKISHISFSLFIVLYNKPKAITYLLLYLYFYHIFTNNYKNVENKTESVYLLYLC